MDQLLSEDLWSTIKRLAKKKSRKRAAIAYVTKDDAVKFCAGDVLVTDASDDSIKSGQTTAAVLEGAIQRGAEVYSLPYLHAKLLVLDGTAVIGSANLSATSEDDLIEAAWVSDSPAAVGMASAVIGDMAEMAARIDDTFLKRIKALPVTPRQWKGRALRQQKVTKNRRNRQTWLVGVQEIDVERVDETDAVEEGISAAKKYLTDDSSEVEWIRFTGRSRFRLQAGRGDSVVQIWRSAGSKRPSCVYRHVPILRRQDESNCTRFFVVGYADADKTAIGWGRFQRLAKQIGLPGKVSPGMARAISEQHSQALFSLWGES